MDCPHCGEEQVAMEEDVRRIRYWCPRNHHWVVETA